ncbi:BON domain-containing protein [Polaromonas sp.]|uniref:BON domain-containing protein n=1 Tax=Polaromonas sp. TaxID=1869339 RepID=UPI00286C4A82|nr:BON domain-containing protein [Polaromonas sp.]
MTALFSNRSPLRRPSGATLAAVSSLALLLALPACKPQDSGKTAGQQLDTAITKTEQAAAEAKAKTESSMANVGTAMKDATQSAETAGKNVVTKVEEKLDDMGITAAVSAGLAKDPDLSAFSINVNTSNGAVTLNGSAPTEAAREKASTIAKGVKGVSSVDNKLVLKTG